MSLPRTTDPVRVLVLLITMLHTRCDREESLFICVLDTARRSAPAQMVAIISFTEFAGT